MGENRTLLCGRCNVRLDVPADAGDDSIVSCPACGESDTLKNALREAGEHFAHKLLSRMLRGADSESSAPGAEPRPALYFRFVEDEDRFR
jgi:hypothetical protein